jgi:uncharacterized protein
VALPPPKKDSTALITGASSGIGADFARELVARGHGVTIAARREDRLRELADELKPSGVRIEVVACDVTDPEARRRLIETIDKSGLKVEVLVNNAGYGSGGLFQELDPESEIAMVRTNCEAVLAFCAEYVPQMVARGRGAILNVGSTAGEQPLPRQATYSATKAFVNTFSDALYADLSGTGVSVTSLRPGPVTTEFGDVAGIEDELFSVPQFAIKTPQQVAAAGVQAMESGKRVVGPGVVAKVSTVSGRLAPRSVLLPMMRRFYPVGK